MSGGFAGIIAKSVIAPIERIKILFLVKKREFSYKQFFADAKYVYKKYGIKNFWRGNSTNIMRVFPHASILLEKPIPQNQQIKKKIALFLAGALAGVTSTTCTYPLEFLRTRLGMQREYFNYKNLSHAIATIKKNEGAKSFYTGMIFPYHGCGFFFFHVLKEKLKIKHPEYYTHPLFDFLFGGIAGFLSQLIAYPFDILRKRRQGQKLLLLNGEITKMKNTVELFKYILKTEGVRKGVYKGITLNMIKAPLSVGTVWTVKNFLNRLFDKTYDL